MKRALVFCLLPLLTIGCTHTLRTTKTPMTPAVVEKPDKPMRVAFTSYNGDRLLSEAVRKVKADPSIAACSENYSFSETFQPDFIVQLNREDHFKSSGQNFFITFPGFILFTHAWAGYKYKDVMVTHSLIMDSGSNVVSEVAIPTPYEFRHCSFGRGAATSCCGWLAPGWGGVAIIPGAIFAAKYDKGATADFFEKAAPSYGDYVSAKLLEQLRQAQLTPKTTSISAPLPGIPVVLQPADNQRID